MGAILFHCTMMQGKRNRYLQISFTEYWLDKNNCVRKTGLPRLSLRNDKKRLCAFKIVYVKQEKEFF